MRPEAQLKQTFRGRGRNHGDPGGRPTRHLAVLCACFVAHAAASRIEYALKTNIADEVLPRHVAGRNRCRAGSLSGAGLWATVTDSRGRRERLAMGRWLSAVHRGRLDV